MSLFFGRKSSKTTTPASASASASAEELVRPRLAKAQSTDTNRFSRHSRSSMDRSNTNGNGRNGATRDSIVSASPSSGTMRGSATNGPQSASSRSSALLHKFQGERPASTPVAVAGLSSKTSSSSSSSSSRGREARRKPIVVHYEQPPVLDARKLQLKLEMDSKGSSDLRRTTTNSIESSQRTYSVDCDADEAPFDVESAMAGFMASFSPSKKGSNSRTSTKKKSIQSSSGSQDGYLKSPVSGSGSGDIPTRASATSSATMRTRSNTLQRISVNFTSSQRHAQRAELKAKKYDVEWRNDQDSMCCQVCYAMFTKISRRRHHCRVCGDLVCGDCSIDQVMIQGRFEAPKRACVACVTLLQVMKHTGDPRVSIDGVSNSKAAACSSNSNLRDQPLATPRYHDRLGEVHRVMTAGKKSERRGSTQTEMYVISSKWLRSWLAFTRSTDGPNNQLDTSSHGGDAFSNFSTAYSPNNNSNHGGMGAPPPGPIDNMPLLELSKGKLVKRPELIRDDSVGDSADDEGDYQLISTEVWEVLQRLYGGGPAIRVVSDDGFRDWIVDVYALLATAASHVAILPTVEHVLVTRHEAAIVTRASYISVEKAALISSGGYESVNILAQSARASFNTGGGNIDSSGGGARRQSVSAPSLVDLAVKSTTADSSRTERASFTTRASMSQARIRPNSPQFGNKKSSSQAHYESSSSGSRMRATAPQQQLAEDAAAAASGTNVRDSSAATAASAFAVAMKQARLNAQKAIDDRSRATAINM